MSVRSQSAQHSTVAEALKPSGAATPKMRKKSLDENKDAPIELMCMKACEPQVYGMKYER